MVKKMDLRQKILKSSERRNRKESGWSGGLPTKCDLCGGDLRNGFVDGRTSYGPWAIMCIPCHRVRGCGLGPGRGQEYDVEVNRYPRP